MTANLLTPTWAIADANERIAARQAIAAGPMKPWIERIDATIGSNPSGFLVGDRLTIADLRAYAIWSDNLEGIPQSYFEQFPNIAAHKAKIAALPKIAEYDAFHK